MWQLALAGGLLGGLQNYFASKSQNDKLEKIKKNMLSNLISDEEKIKKIDNVADVYNNQIADSSNQSALGLAMQGVNNVENYLGSTRAKMLGERAKSMIDTENKVDDYNRNLQLQALDLDLSKADDNPLSVLLSGAMPGALAGAQLGLALDSYNLEKQKVDNISTDNSGISTTTLNNDFTLPKAKVSLGNSKGMNASNLNNLLGSKGLLFDNMLNLPSYSSFFFPDTYIKQKKK